MFTLKERQETGLDFIVYLGEKGSITDRDTLEKIYNEFRNRDGIKDASFDEVISALENIGKAYTSKGRIYLGETSHDLKKAAQAIRDLEKKRSYYSSDKGGVIITVTSDHNVSSNNKIEITTLSTENTQVVKFSIQNKDADSVDFTSYELLNWVKVFSLKDKEKVTPARPHRLNKGDNYEVQVHFKSRHSGTFPVTLAFEFCPIPCDNSKPLYIVRDIEATVSTPLAADLGPETPYEPVRAPRSQEVHRPKRSEVQQVKLVNPLSMYRCPHDLQNLAKQRNLLSVNPMNKNGKLLRTYANRFHLLLHLEELQMKEDVNRISLRLQHRAVDLAVWYELGPVLFPAERQRESEVAVNIQELSLYDRKLEQNPRQYSAVQHIVADVSRLAPYLVFGPPGTGKTVTLVEAMKQVLKLNAEAHILACAPTNNASDLLCQRVQESIDVFRLYAKSLNPCSVPSRLMDCCNFDQQQNCFVIPPKKTLMECKVVVSTLDAAGWLVSLGIPDNHFTHIFVDEAGHATEPKCLIPIAGLLHPDVGQLVLAGDPKQMGPILRSSLVKNYGLDLSLLERLMRNNQLYQKNEQDGQFKTCFVTKLLQNYRSHPAIVKIPNELFYDGELQFSAEKTIIESYCNWDVLPKQGFPVIFHGVLGKEEREGNSPSFFNVAEVMILMDYLKKLLQTQAKKGLGTLSPKDIGIISPYRKQVVKIQRTITTVLNQDIGELKVGSVDDFQGDEKKVILLSTVRSSNTYVKLDQDFSMGLLSCDKRLNVALTRAKALLIVVGNPVVLRKNPTWKRFIDYCKEEGGYDGFDYNDVEDEDQVRSRLALLSISS